mgnify:CR=1 FL=1
MEYIASKGKEGVAPKKIQQHFGFSRPYINKVLRGLEEERFIVSNGLPTSGKKYFVK